MRTICCVVLCSMLVCVPAAFAQDRLLWELQEDFNGKPDVARAITLARRSAIVVGNAGLANGGLDFVIQSFGKSTGAVQWTDRVSSCCGASPVVVTSLRDTVFAAGYVPGTPAGSTDVVVKAFDSPSGTLLWQNVFDTGRDDFPSAIAASPTAVVVVGTGGNTPGQSLDLIVRAFDPVSGALLWKDQIDRGGMDDAGWAVAVTAQRVFVAGTTSSATGRDLLIRAYAASSGVVSWEIGRPATFPVELKVRAGRLFLAGSSSTHTYLAAFHVKSGLLLWEDTAPVIGAYHDLEVNGQRLVATGSAGAGLLVRAFDVRTGVMGWQDQPIVLPGFGAFGAAVALNNDTVYVVGSAGQDLADSEVMVRAYDAATGTLRWDDRSHRSVSSAAVDVALGKNRLFVAGYAMNDFLIRAYSIRNDDNLDSTLD